MKIIVCGAGQVGTGIARQLAQEENDVTVIDTSPEHIQKINDSLDVKAFIGTPSYPGVLENAGAADADMLIAVTLSDEINMISCQVAHSLFGVPVKIARIRHQSYLQPMWKDLYRKDHLPIDYIISPEREVANAIMNRLHVPGAMDMIPFVDGLIKVIEIRCSRKCGLIGMSLTNIREILMDLNVSIIGMVRDDTFIVPSKKDELHADDALFFVTSDEHVKAALKIFGHEEKEARRVLIVGGGNIGFYIAQYLENEEHDINAKLVEISKERAEFIAGQLNKTTVIHGDSLDHEITGEAGIDTAEAVISVTNDDEVNIFSALIAKRAGCQRAIVLTNKSASYASLINTLGIDVTVSPREITVSSILQHVRRGKVRAAHSICGGAAEIIEAEVFSNSSLIGQTIESLDLPRAVIIGAIVREETVIIPRPQDVLQEKDRILLLSETSQLKKVDKLFSSRQDYF